MIIIFYQCAYNMNSTDRIILDYIIKQHKENIKTIDNSNKEETKIIRSCIFLLKKQKNSEDLLSEKEKNEQRIKKRMIMHLDNYYKDKTKIDNIIDKSKILMLYYKNNKHRNNLQELIFDCKYSKNSYISNIFNNYQMAYQNHVINFFQMVAVCSALKFDEYFN